MVEYAPSIRKVVDACSGRVRPNTWDIWSKVALIPDLINKEDDAVIIVEGNYRYGNVILTHEVISKKNLYEMLLNQSASNQSNS